MPAYAAIATDKGYVFCGGEPEVMPVALKPSGVNPSKDFAPSFMSGKMSSMHILRGSLSECMLRRLYRNRRRDFSVNDCPRKIHAKNEKRRNRKINEMNKDAYCFS